MVFYILVAAIVIVGLFLSVRSGLYYYGSRNHRFDFGAFWGGLFGTLMAFIFLPVIYLLVVSSSTSGYEETRHSLSALGNGSETSGSFFLGSGVIDDEQVFQYLRKAEDGGVTLHTVEADRAVVYEDSGTEAYATVRTPYFYDPVWAPWKLDSREDPEIQFHVPEGSINNEYRISVTD